MMEKYLKTKKLDFKTCAEFVPKRVTLDLLMIYYVAVFLFRVQKTIETLHQICTEKYASPEKQGRCSVCTVSPRHVFLETTGVV